METLAQWISTIAALAALGVALYVARRQAMIEATSYLILGLELHHLGDGGLIASTSLENRSPHVKKLDVVFLLVSRCEETPTEAFNAILRHHDHREVSDISEFGEVTSEISPHCSAGDRQYLRLDYYTRENSEVGDEVLTYEAVLSTAALRAGSDYSVRLFLYGRPRLHRVVQRALVAQEPKGEGVGASDTAALPSWKEPNFVVDAAPADRGSASESRAAYMRPHPSRPERM